MGDINIVEIYNIYKVSTCITWKPLDGLSIAK